MGIPTQDILQTESSFDPRSLIGSVLAERYVIEDLLGTGGMGAVYRATQLKIGRQVAIKIIIPSESVPKTLEDRFFREAQIMSGLSNGNIVQLYDFGESGPILFLVMELVEGELVSRLLSRGRLAPPLAREIAYQVAGGLIEAHSKGVVHRDLKPGNMLVGVGPDGRLRVKIFDFGIAYPRESEVKITKTGLMCGTPAYLAPEQIRGTDITEAADLYSLGICLFEMLTGKMPFSGATMQVMFKHVQEAPPSLVSLAGTDIPRDLSELVDLLLQKKPEDRPPSALHVRGLLEESIEQPLKFDPNAEAPLEPFLMRPIDLSRSPRIRKPPAPEKGEPPSPDVSEPFKHASDEVKGAWSAFLNASEQPISDSYDMVDPNVDNYSYTGPTGAFEPVQTPAPAEWNTTNDWKPADSMQETAADTQIDQGLEIELSSISTSMPKTSDYQAITQEPAAPETPEVQAKTPESTQKARPSFEAVEAPELQRPVRQHRTNASSDETVSTGNARLPRSAIFAMVGVLILVLIGSGLYWLQSTRFTPEEDTLTTEELKEYWEQQEEAERRAFERAAERNTERVPQQKPRTEPGDLKKKKAPARASEEEVIDLWEGQDKENSGGLEIERKR